MPPRRSARRWRIPAAVVGGSVLLVLAAILVVALSVRDETEGTTRVMISPVTDVAPGTTPANVSAEVMDEFPQAFEDAVIRCLTRGEVVYVDLPARGAERVFARLTEISREQDAMAGVWQYEGRSFQLAQLGP